MLDVGEKSYAASEIVRSLQTATMTRRQLVAGEWLVTNGLGGYASGTLAGPPTRRYHALLVAALAAPLGRVALLTHVDERIRLSQQRVAWFGPSHDLRAVTISDFRLVGGLPIWRYTFEDVEIEKRVVMPHEQNTVLLTYTVVRASEPIRFGLRPLLGARLHETPVHHNVPAEPVVSAHRHYLEVVLGEGLPTIRLAVRDHPAAFTLEAQVVGNIHYELEEQRGYPADGSAWSPGYYKLDLAEGEQVAFVASVEPLATMDALSPHDAWHAELDRRTRLLVAAGSPPAGRIEGELVLAADQFLIKPAARTADAARARAAGGNVRSVIAGYHWFTDWGRDTMISLEGLALATGRVAEARDTLLMFAQHLRDGLIPNLFPEGDQEGLYHTADATLWFFHALDRYLSTTDDREVLMDLLPALDHVVACHRAGTRFGIGAAADGLITQGDPTLPLTWMDAKVDGWVVTPRRGKAVEINALWFNALSLLDGWHRMVDSKGPEVADLLGTVKDSFNRRFWCEEAGHLYDVVDGDNGDDASCRPNQILAFALRYPVLDPSRWAAVLDVVSTRLLTPFGLRTLAASHAGFKAQYFGDLRARDAAYHQGTVWPWLIGPFIDAWLRVHPGEYARARAFLDAFPGHLDEACVGSISEIFDATEPYAPRGCIAQAWSVAEVLRCFTALDRLASDGSRSVA
jgi:predicted glycogen debranching enzyme